MGSRRAEAPVTGRTACAIGGRISNDQPRRIVMERFVHAVVSEPKYYLYGVGVVIVGLLLALLFFTQTGITSGRG
jgi:hypothetical protein